MAYPGTVGSATRIVVFRNRTCVRYGVGTHGIDAAREVFVLRCAPMARFGSVRSPNRKPAGTTGRP
jgi:hypothetical protein